MDETPLFPKCETIITTFEPDYRYCGYTVSQLGDVDLSPFAPLMDGESASPGELLFLDTETTGLSSGAGTVAFLLGVGHFCKNGFIVKQYLMRDYDEEASLLDSLGAELGARKTLVSFNGKAFDMNLLESRCIMNGIRMPKTDRHIDLLRPARRIWRRCLDNCRLTTIENAVLGETREDDTPGSQIPQVFFEFLETREWEAMHRVLRHNRFDILAMAAILKYISDLIERARNGTQYDTDAYNNAGRVSSGRLANRIAEELLGLAGFFYSMKDGACVETCLHKSIERNIPAITRRALTILAEMKKREGNFSEAVGYWNRLLEFAPRIGLHPYIELAKYYEHKAREPSIAKEYADQAQILASTPVFRDSGASREIGIRQERLRRKIARQAERKNKNSG